MCSQTQTIHRDYLVKRGAEKAQLGKKTDLGIIFSERDDVVSATYEAVRCQHGRRVPLSQTTDVDTGHVCFAYAVEIKRARNPDEDAVEQAALFTAGWLLRQKRLASLVNAKAALLPAPCLTVVDHE